MVQVMEITSVTPQTPLPEVPKVPRNQPQDAAQAPGNELVRSAPVAKNSGKVRGNSLTLEERRELAKLKARDAEVRQHEHAHLAAAGTYARSGAKLEYVTGPDGQRYAIGGEVEIDTAEIPGDPDATLQKAEVVHRAALAPAQPSTQDRLVAAKAARMAMEARVDLAREKAAEAQAESNPYAHNSLVPSPVIDWSILDQFA